jgi:hypothetical protein
MENFHRQGRALKSTLNFLCKSPCISLGSSDSDRSLKQVRTLGTLKFRPQQQLTEITTFFLLKKLLDRILNKKELYRHINRIAGNYNNICNKLQLVRFRAVQSKPVLRSRIIFMRLRLRVQILMRLRLQRLRLRLLPYCIARQNFLKELQLNTC